MSCGGVSGEDELGGEGDGVDAGGSGSGVGPVHEGHPAGLGADGRRRIGARARTIDEYFEDERPLLLPLPEERFETGWVLTPRVDRYRSTPPAWT
ncbi:hypothetical protein GCM10010207_88080 [Streptomyces atratus]|nr:hypothetical protein GCM10010207_88080 [Streptomyces atratus]